MDKVNRKTQPELWARVLRTYIDTVGLVAVLGKEYLKEKARMAKFGLKYGDAAYYKTGALYWGQEAARIHRRLW